MKFLVVLAVTVATTLALCEPLKRWPVAFYSLAVAVVLVFFAGANGLLPGTWWKPLTPLVQRCMVTLSLFMVVMFIGVLPKGSRLDSCLRPVRAEISIVACILCMGHILVYLVPYASRFVAGGLEGVMLLSVAVAFVLAVLLLVLGVTSLTTVKRRMRAVTWKRIQRLAYVFFGLAYVHLLCMLGPAAFAGSPAAAMSVAVYTLLFGMYAVLRTYRWRKDRLLADGWAAVEEEDPAVPA